MNARFPRLSMLCAVLAVAVVLGFPTQDALAQGQDPDDETIEALQRQTEDRVDIVGWSHGGLHALMNIFFAHGDAYAVAYHRVLVSDLIARMGQMTEGYPDLYSAEFHIGKTAHEDVDEYRRRSRPYQHRGDPPPRGGITCDRKDLHRILRNQHRGRRQSLPSES